MGCASSSGIAVEIRNPPSRLRAWPGLTVAAAGDNGEDEEFHALPAIDIESVTIGNHVQQRRDGPNIICVFGGPHSNKGKGVQYLADAFGFNVINLEQLLMKHLRSHHWEEQALTTQNLLQLANDEESINMNLALDLVQQEIDANPSAVHVLDLLPNLTALQRSACLLKDAVKIMARNDRQKWQCRMALYFKRRPPTSSASAPKQRTLSDDADAKKKLKRSVVFGATLEPFLSFFESQQRVVSLDHRLTPVQLQTVLRNTLADLDFHPDCVEVPSPPAAGRAVLILGTEAELRLLQDTCQLTEEDVREISLEDIASIDARRDTWLTMPVFDQAKDAQALTTASKLRYCSSQRLQCHHMQIDVQESKLRVLEVSLVQVLATSSVPDALLGKVHDALQACTAI